MAAGSPERMGIPVSLVCKNFRRRLERYFSFADVGGICPALFGQFLEHDPVVSKMRQITSSFWDGSMREEIVGSLVGRLGITVSMSGSILEGGTSAVMVVFKWDLKRVL